MDVGELNGDGMPDLVVVDDGIDRYLRHQGNDPQGLADFTTLVLPSGTNGFGSNALQADLDGDGWNDVIISDVSVDSPGCFRTTDILRNNADPPGVTFDVSSTNIPDSMLQGVYDVAVLDVNGDGKKDLVIGRCAGTSIWISTPSLEFIYPEGLPQFVPPGAPTLLHVELDPLGDTVEAGSPALHVSLNGGPFIQTALDPLGLDLYEGELPAGQCADRFDYYFSAELSGGETFVDPPGAPQETHATHVLGLGAVVFTDSIEGDVSAWTIQSDPSLITGEWEQVDPNGTSFNNEPAAPADDATEDGTMAFVTENGPPGADPGSADVDNGPTWLVTPPAEIDGTNALVSFSAWMYSSVGMPDALMVELSRNGGPWIPVAQIAATGGAWQMQSFLVGDYVEPSGQLQVRFGIADVPNDSITEAGIDDFAVTELDCPAPCPWDLDGSGDVGVIDLLSLLAAWGTDPAGPPDFDGDGSVGVIDLLTLLAAWGDCL